MIRGAQSQVLKSLNKSSSLAVLLRALYRIGLDYCVLPPADDFAGVIVFAKDQLVSLIERTSPETTITEIGRRVAQGLFKPVAIFKSDESSGDFIARAGFSDSEQLQVLRVDDEGSDVLCLHDALRPRGPDFPEWWEAPVPFAMYGKGKLHINHTAELMFGSDLKRLSASDLPDKNEFLVALENSPSPCSVTFRRLEGDLFMLDDSTGDVMAAADITWWASVGKAYLAKLDQEKLHYSRCEQLDEAKLESLRENNLVFPCEWDGELLGYLCVENAAAETGKQAAPQQRRRSGAASRQVKEKEKETSQPRPRPRRQEKSEKPVKPAENELPEDETLKALGPQALGLLVPSSRFAVMPAQDAAVPPDNAAPNPDAAAVKRPARPARPAKEPRKQKNNTGSDV